MKLKKKARVGVLLLTAFLTSIACNMANPVSSFGRAIEKMFESIARSIRF